MYIFKCPNHCLSGCYFVTCILHQKLTVMKKLFFTLTSFLLTFLLFACTKESIEKTNSFIEGEFVSGRNANVCIWDLDWTNPREITSDGNYNYPPKPGNIWYDNTLWSSDGTHIMCSKKLVNHGESIWVMDRNGENSTMVLQLNESILAMDWSNDDKWIAYSTISDGSIYIVSMDGQEHKILNEKGEYQIRYISWSADSKRIAFYTYAKDLFIVDVTTEETHSLPYNSGIKRKPCWSPNDEFLALSKHFTNWGQIVILNVDNNSKEIVKEGYGLFPVFSWTPDGEYIIYLAGTEFTLEAMHVSTDSIIDLGYKDKIDVDNPRGDIFISSQNNNLITANQ